MNWKVFSGINFTLSNLKKVHKLACVWNSILYSCAFLHAFLDHTEF